MKVLFDTNVVVDVLQKREPWCEAGSKLFLAAANRLIDGFLTAKELTDIHFFSRKQYKGQENVDALARDIITKLMTLFDVVDTLSNDCREALVIPNNDYEDAVMIASAQRAGMDCIVTRNPEHFRACAIPVYSPEELLRIIAL